MTVLDIAWAVVATFIASRLGLWVARKAPRTPWLLVRVHAASLLLLGLALASCIAISAYPAYRETLPLLPGLFDVANMPGYFLMAIPALIIPQSSWLLFDVLRTPRPS